MKRRDLLGLAALSLVSGACGSLAALGPTPTATRPPVTPSGAAGATPSAAPVTVPAARFNPTAAMPTVANPTATPRPVVVGPMPPLSAPRAIATAPARDPRVPAVSIVAKGLDTPWAIDFALDGRAFITERPGRIRILRSGVLLPEPWATLTVYEGDGRESGLLGLALDPQFATNGYLYVAHTYRSDGKTLNRLVRMREERPANRGVLDSVLVENIVGNDNHDGGRVKIGPDSRLYWTMGDAFFQALAQDPALPNGKILRLNRDGTIPADNPFPNSPVYSLGHRNPQGLAWQPGSRRLYATEHGPSGGQGSGMDEVNLIEPGKNYGWPTIRGDETRDGLVGPVRHSTSAVTWAPGGATFVTRGPWQDSLVFTGLRGEALYRLVIDPAEPRKVSSFETHFQRQYGRLRDVVEGPDGALYVLTSNRDGRGTPHPDDDRVLRLAFG